MASKYARLLHLGAASTCPHGITIRVALLFIHSTTICVGELSLQACLYPHTFCVAVPVLGAIACTVLCRLSLVMSMQLASALCPSVTVLNVLCCKRILWGWGICWYGVEVSLSCTSDRLSAKQSQCWCSSCSAQRHKMAHLVHSVGAVLVHYATTATAVVVCAPGVHRTGTRLALVGLEHVYVLLCCTSLHVCSLQPYFTPMTYAR